MVARLVAFLVAAAAVVPAGPGQADIGQSDDATSLLATLRSGTDRERVRALERLHDLASLPPQAVPALLSALADPALQNVRYHTIETIGRMGPRARSAVPALVQLWKGERCATESQCEAVMLALGHIGAQDGIAVLIDALGAESKRVTSGAITGLSEIGPPAVGPLISALAVERNDSLANTVAALGRIGLPAVPALIAALDDTRDQVVGLAVETLADIGPPGRTAVPRLFTLARSPDPSIRYGVVRALTSIDLPAGLPMYKSLVNDSDWVVARAAAVSIGRLGTVALSAEPELVGALGNHEPEARAQSALALSQIGARSGVAVSGVQRLLSDPDSGVRATAALSLGQMGSAARTAIPDIERLLSDPDRRVRDEARSALEKLRRRKGRH